ncbi:MAG: OmpA family protein [Treponema sp.]|nr:OmpA family protein [Treponema sp.]
MKNRNKTVFLLLVMFLVLTGHYVYSQNSPFGADAVPDLYSASLAGAGSFTTSTGGAPASAINPAQGGDAHRMIFDVSYLAISPILKGEEDGGRMSSLSLGALFPTKYGVFGGSLRYIGGLKDNRFNYFPIYSTFGGNFFAAKEVYPGMSVGAGLNFGIGNNDYSTLSADLGFRYNTGSFAFLENFTLAFVLRGLGVNYFPTHLTPMGGVSFDLLRVEGADGSKDPLVLNASADIGFPSAFWWNNSTSMIFKFGLNLTIAEIVTISTAWPGGSGFNTRELTNGAAFPAIPSVGLSVNIQLPSGGENIVGGRLPSDGDLTISTAFKPLYEGVTAVGGGLSWYVGIKDNDPPVIKVDIQEIPHFSPNNDGKSDTLEIPISITDQGFITSWMMEIKDEEGNIVRIIENKEQRFESFNFKDFFRRIFSVKKHIDVPDILIWNGLKNTGELAPEGRYFFTITATDDSDNTAVTEVFETVLRITPPVINVNDIPAAQRIFDPTGEGGRPTITFNSSGSNEEAWESGMYNVSGERVRTFEVMSGQPRSVVWDGRDDSGNIAPDGVYSFRIGATCRAQTSASAEMTNIILDSRKADVFLTASVSGIKPAQNQTSNLVDFSIRLLLQDGIDNWKLELIDETGEVQRTFSGGATVPANIGWNGLTQQGEIREGVYTPQLTVTYTRGDVISAAATTVIVDVSGPVLTVVTTPEYFSPDNDGFNDELFIHLTAVDASPIANWVFEIRSPEPPFPVFRRIEGRGNPASRIVWDGKSDWGELVQSATYYPYTFSATDILGNSSSIDGRIGVDVLVIRDGDRLKIQIPTIIFRPNYADFVGLDREVIENNERVLRRVAQILNQFREYRVHVEGHANPLSPPGPERDRGEPELRRISEARARAIVDILVRYGVSRNRLTSSGAGSSNVIAEYEDRDNWWKNRRVEFFLIR